MLTSRILTEAVGPFEGLGLFSGLPTSVVIQPGQGDGVIRFTSPDGSAATPAHWSRLTTDTSWSGLPKGVPIRNTTLRADDGSRIFATIEHLMAALAGLGILDATVVLDGPEVPILDGSALPFVEALWPHLGPSPRAPKMLAVRADVRVDERDTFITAAALATPADQEMGRGYTLDYGAGSPLRPHAAAWDGSAEAFMATIAPARTFSMRAEAQAAQALGLFAAFTPRDLPIVGDDGRLIDNAWRFEGEAAAHKLLDLIGDLALVGRPIAGRIEATRSGHALTHRMCGRILALDADPASMVP